MVGGALVGGMLGFLGEKAVARMWGRDVEELITEGEEVAEQARKARALGESRHSQAHPATTQPSDPELQPQQGAAQNGEGMIARLAKSRYNPMRKLTDTEYLSMLQEKLIRVEAEIAIVDEDIAKLETMSSKEREGREGS